ncbi:MAG: DEAD/DEAH box helicase, partial [Limisphaera sp.]|nr:DEAD/DEAH box helicase [Limisphaera sp.]
MAELSQWKPGPPDGRAGTHPLPHHAMNPGGIVRCRNREWVLLPSDNPKVWTLRPLTGTLDEVVQVHKQLAELIGYDLPDERLTSAEFPPPAPEPVQDAASARLLWQAARLTLREGATPFRSLGRISIRPRTYQFVPLLMALRLDPVRLFIADDVGVGKTIEALLIARELLDRGEITRFCVLCPPHLCEQWAREISLKFNLEPVVIRSSTIAALERQTPRGASLYQHFPVQVASIDFVKTDRNRHAFLQFCPEMVIVDEAHAAAESTRQVQQDRHALLQELARHPGRHLVLLTATPHSGVETAFRSLLSLLNPQFGSWNIQDLSDAQRIELARHFVQRTRADILRDWEEEPCFPAREAADETYELSESHRELFDQTWAFCCEIVQAGQSLEQRKRRVRYWAALALLRCVMSSPAAAVMAIANRAAAAPEDSEDDFTPRASVFESAESFPDDEAPAPLVQQSVEVLAPSDLSRLRRLRALAEQLRGPAADAKLRRAIELTRRLLREGYHPILWCRYVPTAEYLAEHLRLDLPENVQVLCVTGRMTPEEREAQVEDIDPERPRVLVATDCLSEGVNLQQHFTAVVHYDLPWNPNRLEQREGRVDRYGQRAPRVKAIRFFGRNNPVDGIVIEVLLDKARTIHRTLGTHVPVPEESDTVLQALLEALFFRGRSESHTQLTLDLRLPQLEELHRRWDRDVERERINRTRFAQRALKPDEVARELKTTDAILGDPKTVQTFVLEAGQRLGLSIRPDRKQPGVFLVDLSPDALATVPEPIQYALHQRISPARTRSALWRVSFLSPTPEGAEYLGRNHPFVATLARFLFEQALTGAPNPAACRCGAIRTRAVSTLTTLYLLRLRHLLEQPEPPPLLAEEVLVVGFRDSPTGRHQLPQDQADSLLDAQPSANLSPAEKRQLIQRALEAWAELRPDWSRLLHQRASVLEESHKRIRRAVSLRVRELRVQPQPPPDLLGILVLQPDEE